MALTRREIFVSVPRVETFGKTTRITADVSGTPLWFESDDVDLEPAPEAFGSALLFPAQHRGRTLRFESPVSEVWRENSDKIIQAWHEWWGYQPLRVVAERRPDENRNARSTALMFRRRAVLQLLLPSCWPDSRAPKSRSAYATLSGESDSALAPNCPRPQDEGAVSRDR